MVERSGIDPAEVGQVVGGCVGQVGMQAANITRTAWLQAGLPLEAAATTVEHAVRVVAAGHQHRHRAGRRRRRRRRGRVRRRGDERGADGLDGPEGPVRRQADQQHYWEHYENTSQFEGAERIAEKFGVTRDELDAFGKQSQDRAAAAWAEGRFDTQIVPIDAPTRDESGEPNGTQTVTATRACARRRSRRSPTSSRCSTAIPPSTPPAPRRRSATAPARCCS